MPGANLHLLIMLVMSAIAAVDRSERSSGFTLLEVLLVTSIIATLAMVSVPVTAGALDEIRTAMAARYLEGRILNARATAVKRSTRVALRFEAVDGDYRFGEFADGNSNGVRTSEIAAGLDPEIAPPRRLSDHFPGIVFGVQPGVKDVDGAPLTAGDGLRIGASRLLTLGPDGTATSGTLYVHGRRGQYAVRILGATGRTRVLRFDRSRGQWIVP
jgi:prepilin-type N-terminal cleavage/methylation domain-containing protein